MTAIAAYPLLASAAAKRCGTGVRGVEKTGTRRQFHGEYGTSRDYKVCIATASASRAPCQFGTDEYASFWNGPRLVTAFAAQVLAQAMGMTHAQSTSAHAAYRKRAVRSAPFFDENF